MGAATLKLFSPDGETVEKAMHWDSPQSLSAMHKISEAGCYRGVVQVGKKVYKTGPISVPVSPEFLQNRDRDFGRQILSQMAAITGGKQILDVRELFKRSDYSSVVRPVIFPFLILFLLLFLVDIAEARFGLQAILFTYAAFAWSGIRQGVGKIRRPIRRSAQTPGGEKSTGKPLAPAINHGQRTLTREDIPVPSPPTAGPASPAKNASGGLDYLSQSKARAQRRFGRRP